MELNNREIALLVWSGVALVALPGFFGAAARIVAMTARSVFGFVLVIFAAYLAGLIALASELGLWEPALFNDAVLWFFAMGLPLLWRFERAYGQPDFFSTTIKATLGLTIFIEVFVGLAVFPLLLELLLLPVVTVLTMLLVFTSVKRQHEPVRRAAVRALMVLGVVLVSFVAVSLALDHGLLNVEYGARLFALPVWLTLGCLPFVYALGLYAAYDSAFNRIDSFSSGRSAPASVKLALVSAFHLRARRVGSFTGPWLRELADAASFQEARGVCARFLTL